MKKLITLIVISFLTITTYAQGVSFGPRVGMNISKLNNNNADYKLGLNVGAFFTGYFTPHFGIEVAAMFSQEGSKKVGDVDGFSNDVMIKTNLNYLNIPVVAKFNIIGGLNVFAGPQFGVLLNAREKIDNKVTFNIKDSFYKTNLSGVVGTGYRFRGGLDIAVNYNFTFTKSNKSFKVGEHLPGLGNSYTLPSMRGGTWQLTLGYAF